MGDPPVIKTRAWRFDPNEATVETELGPAELEYIDAEFRVIRRAYPSKVGRLLSYESPGKRVANVDEREVSLGAGKTVRVIISGGGTPNSMGPSEDQNA